MHQTYIFLTETFLQKEKLEAVLATNFFENENRFRLQNLKNFDQKMEVFLTHKISENQVLLASFDAKKDFTQEVFSFYQNYNKPTMLFLGDLSHYSVALQEGMLRFLEEPPANLYLILTAQNKAELLPTISSRSNILKLPQNLIIDLLDPVILEKVQAKFPIVKSFYTDFLKNKVFLDFDFAKLERDEIDFWLWQLEFYLKEVFKHKKDLRIAKKIQKILESKLLNQQNLQKKFVIENLYL